MGWGGVAQNGVEQRRVESRVEYGTVPYHRVG